MIGGSRIHACVNASPAHLPTSRIARILAKAVLLTTARREANYSSETINIRDDSSSRDNRNIMDVNSNKKSATKEKPAFLAGMSATAAGTPN
jgi:hypothetical protein